ncbi:MAG TPA: hypothetical protein VFV08_08660, partial [Puia sp.]|nr:hypothetical protein [Puia sp.]
MRIYSRAHATENYFDTDELKLIDYPFTYPWASASVREFDFGKILSQRYESGSFGLYLYRFN